MLSSMHLSDMTLADVDAIEENAAFLTEFGWVTPLWVIELRASIILRNALLQYAIVANDCKL